MPSDPSGARPMGVLTRPAPDFFDDNLYVGGYRITYNIAALNNYITVALFNTDNLGRVLKVYGLSLTSDAGEGFDFWFVYGQIGTLSPGPYPLRPDYPAPPAQIYIQSQPAAPPNQPNPLLPTNLTASLATYGFDGSNIFAGHPLFIVPVGWSLVASNDVASAAPGVSSIAACECARLAYSALQTLRRIANSQGFIAGPR